MIRLFLIFYFVSIFPRALLAAALNCSSWLGKRWFAVLGRIFSRMTSSGAWERYSRSK